MIEEVAERLGRTETIFATAITGLSVTDGNELRGRLRDASAQMSVVKNTLARRAVNQTHREGLLEHLTGPSALVWVDGDPAQAAKALAGFAKEHSEAVTIKGGLIGTALLSASDVNRLATLPSREQLLGQLAGTLQAPISNLASGMSNMISGLARSLAALRDQRADEQPQSA